MLLIFKISNIIAVSGQKILLNKNTSVIVIWYNSIFSKEKGLNKTNVSHLFYQHMS
jgi:hypothetical protein